MLGIGKCVEAISQLFQAISGELGLDAHTQAMDAIFMKALGASIETGSNDAIDAVLARSDYKPSRRILTRAMAFSIRSEMPNAFLEKLHTLGARVDTYLRPSITHNDRRDIQIRVYKREGIDDPFVTAITYRRPDALEFILQKGVSAGSIKTAINLLSNHLTSNEVLRLRDYATSGYNPAKEAPRLATAV